MTKEENDNHILIEVLNENGDLKLTKFRNPRAIWQNNDYPDEYTFRDVDIVNVFQLQQENQELKKQVEEERNKVREYSYKLVNFRCEETYENHQKEFIEYLENEKNIYPYDISDYTYEDIINTILSKYEDIIEK